MAVRVKVKLNFENKEVTTVALANSGFEGDVEEIVLPINLARKFRLLKKKLKKVSFNSAGGKAFFYELPQKVKVQVLTEDRASEVAEATAYVSPFETEVILNDMLLSKLKIVIVNAGEKIWRFSDEQKERKGESRQEW